MKMQWLMSFTLMTSTAWAQEPTPVGFKDALNVFVQTPIYQSYEQDLRAIQLEFEAKDLVLQPTMELSYLRTREDRELLFRSAATRPWSNLWDFTLAKPFSTGTNLSFNTTWENAATPTMSPRQRDLVEWRVAISQNLWKNSFGSATRLRQNREEFEKKQQLADMLRQRAQLLVDFETLYWDWALTLKEAELQENNLKRSREILRWVNDRYKRSAAEKTDYLNARALMTQRELQVTSIQQRITQALTQLERFIPTGSNFRPNPADLPIGRSVDSLIQTWELNDEGQAVPLAYISFINEADAQALRAKETRDSIRPELNLEASYGKNAIDPDRDEAFSRAYSESNEYSTVGVVFRTGLDLSREYKLAQSAKNKSEALNMRRQSFEAESKIAWDKFIQELKDMEAQIERAKELVDIQSQKANAEKDRYRKGRATAFEAITYEQEVAESELALWNLYALKRKMEARARLFAR